MNECSLKKCDKCVHTRLIISENGLHPICALSAKAAKNCIIGKKDHFIALDELSMYRKEKPND